MISSIPYLSDALPVPGRVLSLRKSFNLSLINSFLYLLEVCKEVIPERDSCRAIKKLKSLNPKGKISGFLGAVHADFLKAIEQKDIDKINTIVQKVEKGNFQIKEITYKNISDLDDYYTELAETISSQEVSDEIEFFSLHSENYECIKKSIENGFDVIKRVSLDFFNESQELVSEILILNSKGVKQGSSIDLFGTIFKSALHKWETLPDILECIIHEQSHLYVYLLSKDDPLILNPLEKYPSPLRKEKRPLIGIFHATFVLSRVHYVLSKALDFDEIPKNEIDYCNDLMSYYKTRFHVGFNTLKENAQMTPLGKELILSASRLL